MLLICGFCRAAPNWGFIAAIYRNEIEIKVSEREREKERQRGREEDKWREREISEKRGR